MRYAVAGVSVLALAVVLAASYWKAASETFTEVEADATPLISGFTSYKPVAHVKEHVLGNTRFEITTDSKHPSTDPRPPYDFLVLSVPSFEHLGYSGELCLSFFNDRLMSTTFYPSDPPTYIAALRRSGVLSNDSDEGSLRPFTRIWSATDYRGRVYVAWADGRLLDQQSRWICRYS